MQREHELVGSNDVFFRPKRSLHIRKRGLLPAHDLNYGFDGRIGNDFVKIARGDGADGFDIAPDKHARDCNAMLWSGLCERMDAASHNAIP